MSKYNILHVTDFHVDNPTGQSENLREGYYKEFLGDLVNKIQENITGKIDFIVFSGDFINKGKVENYTHVKRIVDFLLNKLDVSPKNVSVSVGNHDIIRQLDKKQETANARKDFYQFASSYCFGDKICSHEYYTIEKNENSEFYLVNFDATYYANGSNIPSDLGVNQIDSIINDMQNHIPTTSPLIIVSHYPMILFPRFQEIAEENNWVENHYWKKSYHIVERCYRLRKNSPTLWFFGDGHFPDFTSFNNYHHFLMTGMIGGDYTNPIYKSPEGSINAYNKFNEVRVVEYDTDLAPTLIHTFSYESKSHTYSPHAGFWEAAKSEVRILEKNPIDQNKNKSSRIESIESKSEIRSIELISSSVQDEIINQIRTKKIYSFNRYAVLSDVVSLGWISLNKLFENRELLSRCIEKSVTWLNSKRIISYTNTLFIGIDFWGAILSSQASIISNVQNFCIGTKAGGAYNVMQEKCEFICQHLEKREKEIETIVLFTDVVSTGNTIASIRNKICERIPNFRTNWISISVISDINQYRHKDLERFHLHGTMCVDLKIPMLKTEELPDESILPNKFDIR